MALAVGLLLALRWCAASPEVDAYAAAWAAGGTAAPRCPAGDSDCDWLKKFGPVDVACTFDVTLGLVADGVAPRAPALRYTFANGSAHTVAAGDADAQRALHARPALCESAARAPFFFSRKKERGPLPRYASGPGEASDAALLMVANTVPYVFLHWPLFLNKLLYATAAGLRPFLWVGDLPPALTSAAAPKCFASAQARAAAAFSKDGVPVRKRAVDRKPIEGFRRMHSVYYGATPRAATDASNHYIKMPATLAALAHPTVRGAYYVDVDAVAARPFRPAPLAVHHDAGVDVAFQSGSSFALLWRAAGSRFYARDSTFGRSFFGRWFANRCTFKDQYALWHTVLESAGRAGCVPYDGALWANFTYWAAKKLDEAAAARTFPGLALTCAALADCPGFTYRTRVASCAAGKGGVLDLVDDVFHHTINHGSDPRNFSYATAGGGVATLRVANPILPGQRGVARQRRDGRDAAAFLGALGLLDRDADRHRWE